MTFPQNVSSEYLTQWIQQSQSAQSSGIVPFNIVRFYPSGAGTYTALYSDEIILTSGSTTVASAQPGLSVVLPALPKDMAGKTYIIKDVGTSGMLSLAAFNTGFVQPATAPSGNIVISGQFSNVLLDGKLTGVLSYAFQKIEYVFDGSTSGYWSIV